MGLYPREQYLQRIRGFYDAPDLIKVITGIRGCGKSSLLAVIREELLAKGVLEENIIALDLEQRGYRRIQTADQLEHLIADDLAKDREGLLYLFADEIQRINGFEAVLEGLRLEGNWSIFVSGSHASLLNGEKITKLTGRYLEFEMFPLTFQEYVDMKRWYKIPVDGSLQQELMRYLAEGGFPRTLFLENTEDKRAYIQGLLREIFERDIRPRVKIRERGTFAAVTAYLLNHFGESVSQRDLCTALRAEGVPVTRNTVSRYLQILLGAKVLVECPRFDRKLQRTLSGEKKYYLADLAFYRCQNTDSRAPLGPMLENIVFLYARANGYQVWAGRYGRLEWDFLLQKVPMEFVYVQVAESIMASKEAEDREYRVLEIVPDNYPKYVATLDLLLQQRNGIKHVNLADYLGNGLLF